jgi:transcriptional regulator with XRE-family HTH domain
MQSLLTPADIKRMAASRGISMRQVFQRAGIASSTFSRWQSGKTEPTIGVYRRLVAAVSDGGGAHDAPAVEKTP